MIKQIKRLDSIPDTLADLSACFEITVPTRKILSVNKSKLQVELKKYRDFADKLVGYGYTVTEFIEDAEKPFWRFKKRGVVIGYAAEGQ